MSNQLRWILLAALVPAVCWSVLAIAFLPELPGWQSRVLAFCWGVFSAAGIWISRKNPRWLAGPAAGTIAITLLHLSRAPASSGDWIAGQEKNPRVQISDNIARVENLRHSRYGPNGEAISKEWYADTFALDAVERVDFVHEILSANGLVAHGFLSFAFADGRHLAVSVEARRRTGQDYAPLRGLFRNYELVYVMGQEVDLIGMRANIRKNPVYVYPIAATPKQAQQLFRSILVRADQLGKKPEFYNTLTDNCVTNILLHVNQATGNRIGPDLRIHFPGGADDLIRELGWLDFNGSREEARRRFRINERSRPIAEPLEWSHQIRAAGIPSEATFPE